MKASPALTLMVVAAAVCPVAIYGCNDPVRPTQPSSVQSAAVPAPAAPAPAPAPPGQGSPVWMTGGSFTWTSIVTSRATCPELTSQVGGSWPLSLGVLQDGSSVTLLFAEGAPPDPNDPFAEPPEKFVGTRTGDTITASVQNPGGGMACPTDTAVTPGTGGTLTATVSGNQISGNYTDVYGSGASEVTFTFRFHAGFPSTGVTARVNRPQ